MACDRRYGLPAGGSLNSTFIESQMFSFDPYSPAVDADPNRGDSRRKPRGHLGFERVQQQLPLMPSSSFRSSMPLELSIS